MAEKTTAEIEVVDMTDGRKVNFAGKRKILKDVVVGDDGVSVRFDFRNGETRTFTVPAALLYQLAGHGASQKIGDEAAGEKDLDDAIVAIDAAIDRLSRGEFYATRAVGDGFSGASVVIRAIAEVTGKSVVDVKAFLQGKLDAAKARGETLTRQALYASFRNPATKTGVVIARLEADKKPKADAISADDLLGELGS